MEDKASDNMPLSITTTVATTMHVELSPPSPQNGSPPDSQSPEDELQEFLTPWAA